MEQIQSLTPKAKFFLEQIVQNAREIKSQYVKQIFSANYLHQLQLSGKSNELAILPQEVKQNELYLVYALLEELAYNKS